jgi:hypothetical protein
MNNRKIAAILITALAVSTHSTVVNDADKSVATSGKSRDSANTIPRIHKDTVAIKSPKEECRCKSIDSADSKDEHPKPYKIKWLYFYPTTAVADLLASLLILITAATSVVSILFAGAALRASQRLAADSRDTSRKQLRAYVGWAELSAPPGKTEVVVKNRGNTPAGHIVSIVISSKTPVTLKYIFDLEVLPEQTGMTLSSSERFKMIGDRDSDFPYFAYGRITYTDVFNDPHTTAFQFKVLRDGEHLPWTDGNHED